MTILDSFANYMVDTIDELTLGQNLFLGEVPNSKKVEDKVWWIVDSGGGILTKTFTGSSIKQYTMNVYYRGRDYKTVKDGMYAFEEAVSCSGCVQLEGFQTVELEVISFPVDQDLDSEDRKIGLLQINIKTYKEC